MKKLIAILLSLMLVCGAVSAMAETISIMYGGGTPRSIDPALNTATNGSNTLRHACAGLMGFQLDENGVPFLAPEIAESYEISEDAMTYTFKLREGLRWSNGMPFKASQLVNSWNRAVSEELAAEYAYMYGVVALNDDGSLKISADDEANTFTASVVAPTPYFLQLMAFPTFMPVPDHADNDGVWATDPGTYVGLGAFRMASYTVDDVIVFEKNPYYWNADKVTLETINCYLAEEPIAIQTAYENGTVIFAEGLPATDYDRLNAEFPGELQFRPMLGTYYILMNVHKDLSPVDGEPMSIQDQAKTRIALGKMINRQDLVDYVTRGGQTPATGFFPAGLGDGLNLNIRASETYGTWYANTGVPSEENEDFTIDQVEGINELIALGYTFTGSIEGGDIAFSDIPSIEFSFNNSGANALIIQYVQDTWNKIGISSTINQEPWSTLQSSLVAGDAEAARMGWIADFNDCINFLEIFLSVSGNNYPRLGKDLGTYTRNTEATADAGTGAYWGPDGDQTWVEVFDGLVKAIQLETDAVTRAEMCAEGERILMATGGVAPVYFYTRPVLIKSTIQDLIMVDTNDTLWNYVTITE